MHDDPEIGRGEIKFLKRYKQLNSFRNLRRRRNITPTDIDGLIDYRGNAFVYLEGKMEHKDIERGQLNALEHVVDNHAKTGTPALLLIYEYNEAPDQEIDVGNKYVRSARYNFKWKHYHENLNIMYTVSQMVDEFEKHCEYKLNINL